MLVMANDEYKNHFIKSVEDRLQKLEDKAHVHSGGSQQSDLPRALKDPEVIKFVIILFTVLVGAAVLLLTGENLLGNSI